MRKVLSTVNETALKSIADFHSELLSRSKRPFKKMITLSSAWPEIRFVEKRVRLWMNARSSMNTSVSAAILQCGNRAWRLSCGAVGLHFQWCFRTENL